MRTPRDRHEVRELLRTQRDLMRAKPRQERRAVLWPWGRAVLALLDAPPRVRVAVCPEADLVRSFTLG